MAFNGVTFDFEINKGDPPTATLSIYYEMDRFYAQLSSPIRSTAITISDLAVTGFEDGSCSSLSGESDTAVSNLTIPAGSTYDAVSGSFGMTSPTNGGSTEYYNMANLKVNNTSINDGGTITIGQTTVTVYYPQAAYSACLQYVDA